MSVFADVNSRINERFSTFRGGSLILILIKVLIWIEALVLLLYILNIVFIQHRFGVWSLEPIGKFHGEVWGLLTRKSTFGAMLGLGAPIMLTAMGATFNERAGIINIGLEGIMVWGAWAGVWMSFITGNPWLGAITAIIFGAFFGLVHAVLTISFNAEQIVTGVAINLLALGLTTVLTQIVWNGQRYSDPAPTIPKFSVAKIPVFRWLFDTIPILEALDNHNWLIYFGWLMIPICHILLFYTTFGLRLRVIGEHPQAAATAGVNVHLYQYIAVVFSGAMSGLGGAVLTIGLTSQFLENVVGGQGFIALAAMIFGKWTIIGSVAGSFLFAYFLSLQIKLGINIDRFFVPAPFIQMIPYLVTILALTGFIGDARPPKNIGKPYDPTAD